MSIATLLQSHPLFATFPPEDLAEVVRAGTHVTYDVGDTCIAQADSGEILGVLVSGRLEALRGSGAAGPTHLGYIEPGECFGEMSLLTGSSTNAEVVALTASEGVVFLQEAVAPLLARNREAVQFLTRLMARRLAPAETPQRPARVAVRKYCLGAYEPMRVLALSCRLHDLRYSFYDTASEKPRARGRIEGLGQPSQTHLHEGPGGKRWQVPVAAATQEKAVAAALAALTARGAGLLESPEKLSVVGHRVIHGGVRYNGPTVVDAAVKEEIARLVPLAPLDNGCNLAGIEACERLLPKVPQVAVFDTAFHANLPLAASRYALPSDLARDPELRRFGFHGISHEGAARAAAAFLGAEFDTLRIVSCHLGVGASLTAIDHGRSVDNTMGCTSLGGLVMGTRCGDVDPGLLLYLLQSRGISAGALEQRLYRESGLLGLSGISEDALEVTAAADRGDPQALLAAQVFCLRARKYLSAYVGLLDGVDVVLFTGGIGENAPDVRARICQGLDWMGIFLDEGLNRAAKVEPGAVALISQPNSRARVLVVGGDEEGTIARKAVRALAHSRVTDVMRLKPKHIPIGVSAHHVHLTPEHVERLFGAGRTLTWYADLTQPGQYACQEQVDLLGPKGRIDRVRVLGPVRPESQVEIARTEEFKLGVDAPVRLSGDLVGTPGITIEGPAGQVRIERGVICARRHIHMSPEDAMEFALRDRDVVRVRVSGERSLIFGDVVVRVHKDFRLDMHIDTDEANAAELGKDAYGFLDSVQERATA
jgi:acetate kinase